MHVWNSRNNRHHRDWKGDPRRSRPSLLQELIQTRARSHQRSALGALQSVLFDWQSHLFRSWQRRLSPPANHVDVASRVQNCLWGHLGAYQCAYLMLFGYIAQVYAEVLQFICRATCEYNKPDLVARITSNQQCAWDDLVPAGVRLTDWADRR